NRFTHVTTNAQCDDCHSTRSWIPATFNHGSVSPGTCSSCHNGVQAAGKPGTHFVTNLQCDECHLTGGNWTSIDFRHSGASYPGDHRGNLTCTACHTSNNQVIPWRAAGYAPDCAGCHVSDYKSDPHKKHENPDRRYTVSELRDCSGSCHIYTDSSMTNIKKRRSGEHRVSDGDF
ncbi:MAG: hypothetical protein ABW140_15700, partial [Candidatus Sedimenticola sp. 6PFRAG1]